MTVQESLLADPWSFKEFVELVPQRAAYVQRQALLYLVFPETFEDMVSRDQKSLIVESFADSVAGDLPDDTDRALADIREQLATEYGPEFAFYDRPVVGLWRPETTTKPKETTVGFDP